MELEVPILKPLGSLTLLCVACLTIMVGCVIVPGLPSIAQSLGVHDAASWLVTLPSLGVAVFGLASGRVIARYGARRSLILGLFLYGLIGYSCVWLEGYTAVLTNRFLLGGATALVMSGGTTLISHFFDGDARLRMIARQGMAIELGGVIFLAIGGVLAIQGWKEPFSLYLIGWLLMAMVLLFVPSTSNTLDPVGKEKTPYSVKIWDVYLAAACSMTAFFAAVILLPVKLTALGFDEAGTGYFLSFVSLVAVVAAFFMPRLERLAGGNATLAIAFALYALAHVLFSVFPSIAVTILGGMLIGCGFGFSIPLVNHMTIERSPVERRGHMLGYLSVAIFLGQFLSSFIELAPIARENLFLVAAMLAALGFGVFFRETACGHGATLAEPKIRS
jgi:MFS family permease